MQLFAFFLCLSEIFVFLDIFIALMLNIYLKIIYMRTSFNIIITFFSCVQVIKVVFL
jgi:hypothetical protein